MGARKWTTVVTMTQRTLRLPLVLVSILVFLTQCTCGKKEAESRADTFLTPVHKARGLSDLALTNSIREALYADESLSMLAKNIKIVTVNGQVTLQGPVENEAERGMIVAKARGVAGADRVVDQLQVKSGG